MLHGRGRGVAQLFLFHHCYFYFKAFICMLFLLFTSKYNNLFILMLWMKCSIQYNTIPTHFQHCIVCLKMWILNLFPLDTNKGINSSLFWQVLAYDQDIGPNGELQYSIKSGRGIGKFKIHPRTGVVYSQRGFTAGQEYDLRVSKLLHFIVNISVEHIFWP